MSWRAITAFRVVGEGGRWKATREPNALALAIVAALCVLSPYAAMAQQRQVLDPQKDSGAPEVEAVQLDTIQVTGTRIRGGTTPSPVVTIGIERIREEGFVDLGEVIRSIPQNFSGGQNPGVSVGATTGGGGLANQNITGGSALNLRGLGADATLTLLNGRRMAYGGFTQAVDISAIPVEAVERIDVVPDGASAIYGSDAVGGVANVILKRDYEGVTVGARYGAATAGGLSTREYTATAGTTWNRGGVIATYKDSSSDPVYARQRDYTADMFNPTALYPEIDTASALISIHQSITDSIKVRLDALRTERDQDFSRGSAVLQPWYNRYTPASTTSLISPNVEFVLPGDWSLSVGGSRGRDTHVRHQSRVTIATGAPATLIHGCFCNEALSYEIGAEGPLFVMPAGDARLAVGLGGRTNKYVEQDYLTGTDAVRGDESARFAYAEINLPLVGPGARRAGVHRLDLNVAARTEDYDSFGSVATPKLGLIYGPSADFTVKASWGKSFKAPTLFQRYQARYAMLDPAAFYGGSGLGPEATVLARFGGNQDLDAERATTWATSLVFHPEALPGLEAELTWFDIDYTDRVVEPITDYGRALVNPHAMQFIDLSPTAQAQDEIISGAGMLYNFTGQPYVPENVVALIHGQYVNVARQRVKGLDLSASYRFDLASGRLTMRGSGSWLDSSQQNSAAQVPYEIAGTLFNPARVNGRVGAVWSRDGVSASTFVTYVSGVTDTAQNDKTASFTTIDATLRYAVNQASGVLSGVEIALSAQNLLDRDPPRYAAATPDRPPYDSTNYSAIGRFLSLSVSKHW